MAMRVLFRLVGLLPLPVNHALGFCLGWFGFLVSARHRRLMRANIARFCAATGTSPPGPMRRAIGEHGKGLSELALLWTAPLPRVYALVGHCEGLQHVEAARSANRPIIFVTPHLGCYDIAGRYIERMVPITALYSPPKQAWLDPIMQSGRVRGVASTTTADATGVRQLLRTLRKGGNILILPDQVPAPESGGDGVWAPFFGTHAYTMTLLPRLAASTGAVVLLFFAERLPFGRGYTVHIQPALPPFDGDKLADATMVNRAVEQLIAKAPHQYLWSYNRYKHPAGAPLPPTSAPS
jgi:KDO2-lipid IV(A) lauroyltransferase